ncbi:hypothetical protein H4R99_000197 [Coemansia sp. RSA 1722]|nr:hypothetical protein IWW45_006931 [Coemansia sp. RSA 485]KAJ2601359.1 hypothetical protein GGF39_001275 [Coemansia sp. RSA 1721]KAJ2606771.1 hypothetical protein H4R99_000197 [Coemansia sp. RSA 1722]KAJ2638859.1 hypothetical protein GGF40_001335 [Coemansia sp. RSA 1286]
MTSADEYSLLDSGRVSSAFDPMGTARSSRPRIGASHLTDGINPGEPPSLELLAEMIKEEIRQASSLKQALDRVGIEAEIMSQRVVNMSIAAETNEMTDRQQQQQQPVSDAHRVDVSKRKIGGDDADPSLKKHVQFNIPDDVRFRWLDIFQQPSDPENSDPEDSPEVPKTPALPLTPPDSILPTAGTAATEPVSRHSDAVVPRGASLASKNTRGHSDDGKQSSVENSSSSIDAMPFTANSSVEAVYGGSRTETAEASAVQSRSHISSLAKPAVPNALDEDWARSRLQRILNAAGPDDRRSNLKETAESTTDTSSSSRFATISGKTNRQRIAARLAQENMILGAQRSSTSTTPTLATTKVTVPKRYSVSPPFTAPQMDNGHSGGQSRQTSTANGESSAPGVSAALPPVHRSDSAQSTGSFELLTGSMRRRRNSHDGSSSSLRQKDSSSIENYPLSAINGASITGASSSDDGKQKQEHQGGGGRLLRRVTTTAAQHRSNRQQNEDHISGIIGGTRDFFKNRLRSRTHSTSNSNGNSSSGEASGGGNDDGNGGAGGSKPAVLVRAQDKPGPAEYRMNTLSSAGNADALERARRRSDAEVKSRLPPLPLTLSSATGLQAQFATKPHKQQRRQLASEMLAVPSGRDADKALGKSGNVGADSANAALHQSLSPTDRRSESGRAPQAEAVRGQRKSHDDALPMHLSKKTDAAQGDQRNGRGVQTRTSSAEYARKQPQQTSRRLFAAPLETTMKLTKAQIELLRLRPASSSSNNNNARDGVVSSSDRKSGEAVFPNLGPGGSGDNSNDDDEAYSAPPLPKMPPLPPLPPHAAQSPLPSQRPQAATAPGDKKSTAGDTDSIDYHLRRLKSDKKTRRSSFMTTLSNMLGRKD